jgi:hypothetical protein
LIDRDASATPCDLSDDVFYASELLTQTIEDRLVRGESLAEGYAQRHYGFHIHLAPATELKQQFWCIQLERSSGMDILLVREDGGSIVADNEVFKIDHCQIQILVLVVDVHRVKLGESFSAGQESIRIGKLLIRLQALDECLYGIGKQADRVLAACSLQGTLLVPFLPITFVGQDWKRCPLGGRFPPPRNFVDDMIQSGSHVVDGIAGGQSDVIGRFLREIDPHAQFPRLTLGIRDDLAGLSLDELGGCGYRVSEVLVCPIGLESPRRYGVHA